MLFRKELIEALADTLEAIVLPAQGAEQSIVLYHGGRAKADRSAQPTLEIVCTDAQSPSIVIHSALGMMELRNVEEVRLSRSTEEAAFYLQSVPGAVSVVTVSSRGVLQSYQNVPARVRERELTELEEGDLRAAVALKIFAEAAEIFSHDYQHTS